MHGHWIDCLILLIVGLSVLTSVFRGFVKEVLALCVWALSIWLAYTYADSVTPLLSNWIQDASLRTVVAFIAILISSLLAGGICNASISFMLKRAGLSGTDRTLGVVFGLVRGIGIVGLLIIGVQMTSLPVQEYEQQSILYAQFQPVVSVMRNYMPDFIQKIREVDVHKHLGEPETVLELTENE